MSIVIVIICHAAPGIIFAGGSPDPTVPESARPPDSNNIVIVIICQNRDRVSKSHIRLKKNNKRLDNPEGGG